MQREYSKERLEERLQESARKILGDERAEFLRDAIEQNAEIVWRVSQYPIKREEEPAFFW
ncbi:MAG: hypothetical protein HY731_06035 [Candidatus Tectomicrobia bacterium]|nr:hypothetical protein [Candidatus Tectomicrobia bacterium]